MFHSLVLSPCILFFNNQNACLKSLYETKYKEEVIEKDDFTFIHYLVNSKPYTFITDRKKLDNIFLKGHHRRMSFNQKDIILKSGFNLKEGCIHNNMEITADIEEIYKIKKPSYNSISFRSLDHFCGLDKEAFNDFIRILKSYDKNNNVFDEMIVSYKKEYDLYVHMSYTLINDMFTLQEKSIKNKKQVNKLLDTYCFAKIDNCLIYNTDGWFNLILFKDDEFLHYSVDKDSYCSKLSDQEYEDDKTIFFSIEDIKNRLDDVKKVLEENYYVGKITKTEVQHSCDGMMHILFTLFETNKFLFKKMKVIDKKREMKVSDVSDLYFTLYTSTDFYWNEESLYNPNKVNLDYSFLNKYKEKNPYEYYLMCSSYLLDSYSKNLNDEWKTAVMETLNFGKTVLDKINENSLEMCKENYNNLIKYNKKIIAE